MCMHLTDASHMYVTESHCNRMIHVDAFNRITRMHFTESRMCVFHMHDVFNRITHVCI